MNRTFTFTSPRLVGAFVLAVGLLVAGMAVGVGPAGAVMDRGGDEPSITELNWQCNDETRICECTGGFLSADCVALYKANPDCKFVHAFADGAEWCRVPDGEPIFTKSVTPEDDPTLPIDPGQILDPRGSDGKVDSGRSGTPDEPETPEVPETPEQPAEPPTDLPPGVDPGDVIGPGDLPGAEDPGRTGSGNADSSTGSMPLDPGGLDR